MSACRNRLLLVRCCQKELPHWRSKHATTENELHVTNLCDRSIPLFKERETGLNGYMKMKHSVNDGGTKVCIRFKLWQFCSWINACSYSQMCNIKWPCDSVHLHMAQVKKENTEASLLSVHYLQITVMRLFISTLDTNEDRNQTEKSDISSLPTLSQNNFFRLFGHLTSYT